MRTETIERNIYKLDELPEHIQDSIVLRWRDNDTLSWSDEWQDSLNEFKKLFSFLTVKEWRMGSGGDYINFNLDFDPYSFERDEQIKALSGVRAFKWLRNNSHEFVSWAKPCKRGKRKEITIYDSCPLTGYCGDESLLEPLREFMRNPDAKQSIEDIFYSCLNGWLSDYAKDYDYWLSEESIREDIACNDCEFLIDGSLV